jgi:hypothetical protein
MKMSFVFAFLLLLFVLPVAAQDSTLHGRTAIGGLYYSADVPGTVGGFGAMTIPLPIGTETNKLQSFSGFKVFGAKETEPANLVIGSHRLRYKAFTGVSYALLRYGWFSVHALADGGIISSGTDTSGTADLGGFVHVAFTPRVGMAFIAAAEYDGIESAWVVNPAGGFTFKF